MDYKEVINLCDYVIDNGGTYDDLVKIKETLQTCRNELCLKCGYYKDHVNVCADCRWKGE